MLSKKNIFRIILVLIPFLIIILLELTLRLFGYQDDLNFISTVERNGQQYYTINQLVGKRYFDKDRLYYRKGSHDYFEINKSPNTLRVFCLGASTMAGFPFEYNDIPSEFLRERLVDAFPGKNIEVINTAIAATNSFTVDEFADELTKYKPDLFVVYMGQNEFYGVYGVGSTISIGKNRSVIKAYLWFEHFRTFLLLKNVINSIGGIFNSDDSQNGKILMEEMAKTSIRYNSDDFKTAVNTFRDNYIEVIQIAQQHKIPIIISTLVTNEKNLPPFISFNSNEITDSFKNKSKELYKLGLEKLKTEDYQAAAEDFKKSISIDSIPAETHYYLGKCYEQMKIYSDAENQYKTAIDFDGLRFRAPSQFNQIINSLGNQYNVPIARVDKMFRDNSKNGIIGSELLVDHVHPNIDGYFLLAKSWYQTILKNKLLGISEDKQQQDSTLWKLSAITKLDSVIGEIRIQELRSRPPFSKDENGFNYEPGTPIEQIAYQYVILNQLSWAEAHVNVAKAYVNAGNYFPALQELRAVLISDDENPMVLKLAGDMSLQLNQFKEAEDYYVKANKYSPNQFIEYKLGKAELALNKTELAIQFLNSALERNKQAKDKFNPSELEDIYYNLAGAYNRINEPEKAKEMMQKLFR
jgi:tetratricopeptide (TPR) repeat protein